MPNGATIRPRTIIYGGLASGGLGRLLHQTGHRRGQLGAVLLPVGHALGIDHQALLALGSDGVVVTHALDEAAVATAAGIGGDDVVEGALLGAAAGEADHNHFGILFDGNRKTGNSNSITCTDRKSTRLNSSHHSISYAVFCLKKKKIKRFKIEIKNIKLRKREKKNVKET